MGGGAGISLEGWFLVVVTVVISSMIWPPWGLLNPTALLLSCAFGGVSGCSKKVVAWPRLLWLKSGKAIDSSTFEPPYGFCPAGTWCCVRFTEVLVVVWTTPVAPKLLSAIKLC